MIAYINYKTLIPAQEISSIRAYSPVNFGNINLNLHKFSADTYDLWNNDKYSS